MVSVEGVTDVPAEESASPSAETPGAAGPGPTLIAVTGAGALAGVTGAGATAVEAGAVPVVVGRGAGEVAGAVPDGVRMSEVAVVGAEKMVDVDVGAVAPVPAVVLLALAAAPGVAVEVPM